MIMRKVFYLFLIVFLCFFSCEDEEKANPVASFTVDKTVALLGEKVSFYNNSTNSVAYEWNFGDGSATSSSENPSHIYNEKGLYTATLKAIGEYGSSSSSVEISVLEAPRIFPGISIDQYNVGDIWTDILEVIASDYYYYSTDDFGSTYLHTYVIESEQLAIYLESSNSNEVQDNDPVFFVSAWGNYDGRTPTNIKIGSTLSEVYDIYGVPEIENGNGYVVYYYLDKGILFYSENEIVREIDIFPPIKSLGKTTYKTISLLKELINKS